MSQQNPFSPRQTAPVQNVSANSYDASKAAGSAAVSSARATAMLPPGEQARVLGQTPALSTDYADSNASGSAQQKADNAARGLDANAMSALDPTGSAEVTATIAQV